MANALVTAAPLGHELPDLPEYRTTDLNLPFTLHVLLLLVGRGISPEGLDNHVNNFVLPRLKDEPDVVLVRTHPSQVERVRAHLASGGVAQRFDGRPIGCLTTDLGSGLWSVDWTNRAVAEGSSPLVDLSSVDFVALSRDAELRLYSTRPGALLPASNVFHYEGPSGAHYTSYFRGSFAFQSRDAVDGLAFWLWPLLPVSASILLLDSPFLLGVGLGVVDYLRREIGRDLTELPSIEARESYNEQTATVAHRLEMVVGDPAPPVTILTTIASTGATLRNMRDACTEAGLHDVREIVLFAGEGTLDGTDAVHELPHAFTRYDGDCPECVPERKPTVLIRPDTNLVEVSALVQESRVTFGAARLAREFFGRHGHLGGLVSVHKNQHDDRRHHVIDLDVAKLASSPQFRDRVRDLLAGLRGKGVVVLHPDHDGAASVAAVAGEVLGAPVVCREPQHLGAIGEDERELLSGAELVLLADDVAISGSRLRQYRAWLNATHIVSLDGQPRVAALLGVLRASSPDRRQAIHDMVDAPELMFFAEELPLPDWQELDCPWCQELSLLRDAPIGRGSLMSDRRGLLQAAGLTKNLFLPWSGAAVGQDPDSLVGPEDPVEQEALELLMDGVSEVEVIERLGARVATGRGREALELGPRSILGPLRSEAQVFAAVASSLQVMRGWERDPDKRRQEASLAEVFTSPISRVLAPEYYFTGRFYAPVILGSILRSVRRFDVRATAIEGRLRRAVGERLSDHPIVRPEITYAVNRKLLPRPSELADHGLFEGCDRSTVTFLNWL